jgi:dolichyl-phosphate beta-glucosyltransferase
MAEARTPLLTVIVPCFNEGPTLRASLDRLLAALEGSPWSHEVVFVDDGSRDDTRATVDRFVAERASPALRTALRTAHHDRNRGRGAAVLTGLAAARGEVAGFLDIDLEVSELYIAPCVQAVLDGADVAIGRRYYDLQPHSLLRHVLSRGYAACVRALLGTALRDTESGFKWFRSDAIAPLLPSVTHRGWFFDTEIMVRAERAGLRIAEVPVRFVRRFDKASTVRPLRDSVAYLLALTRFRTALMLEGRPAPVPRAARGRAARGEAGAGDAASGS